MIRLDDTIAALATGAAPGGICVVRISGPAALEVARRMARLPDPTPPRQALLVEVVKPDSGEVLDEAIALYFAAPASFTGEEVVEIHGHGGVAHGQALAAAALLAGARAAEPGEFSRRAVMNGKLSLERAEAIADLAGAETEAGLRAARAQLTGALGKAVREIAEGALGLRAEVEASLDFPDDAPSPPFQARAAELSRRCDALLATHAAGVLLHEGVRVVLAGAPNAGKSSLFNALLAEDRALVDPEAGTTRDSLEARIDLDGIPCTLVDTAGLREDGGRVERLGVGRTRTEVERAGVRVWVVDATGPVAAPGGEWMVVVNKHDLADPSGFEGAARVSALTGEGMRSLRGELAGRARGPGAGAMADVVLTSRRHAALIAEARDAFRRAGAAAQPELAAYDLRDGAAALDRVLGKGVSDELLDEIFARFCLGK